MMRKFKIQSSKFKIILLFVFCFLLLLLYPIPYTLYPTYAQTADCITNQTTTPRVTNGLITTSSFTSGNLLGTDTTGSCIKSDQVPFVPFKIPTYNSLKSLYYTQAKTITGVVTKNSPNTSSSITLPSPTANTIDDYTYTAASGTSGVSISIAAAYQYSGVALIFVEHDLFINSNIVSSNITTNGGLSGRGLVFVVGGNVNIARDVSQIDAVIISQGIIYTATTSTTTGADCATSTVTTDSLGHDILPLTVNGSLISLQQPPVTNPTASYINFCRKLPRAGNNTTAAEEINQQPKYLVILRNLFSETFQKWSEIQ